MCLVGSYVEMIFNREKLTNDASDRNVKGASGPAVNAFTVDLEDWYQGIELPLERWPTCAPRLDIGLTRVLDLLEKHGVRATFFVLGWIAERHPLLVKEVARRGHELGSHGNSHDKVYHLGPDTFRKDIRITRDRLQDIIGRPVVTHRSPFFSITSENLWALDVLAEEGFTIDCSISPIKTWRYGIRSCPDEIFRIGDTGMMEFPVSSFNILNKRWAIGGAYFRILPYWFTQNAFRKRVAAKKYTMFYLHPWECDPDHPRVPMEGKARLTHYARLNKTVPYLDRLLQGFNFDSVSAVVTQYAANHHVRNLTPDMLKD